VGEFGQFNEEYLENMSKATIECFRVSCICLFLLPIVLSVERKCGGVGGLRHDSLYSFLVGKLTENMPTVPHSKKVLKLAKTKNLKMFVFCQTTFFVEKQKHVHVFCCCCYF
jgi:hypothetical protein